MKPQKPQFNFGTVKRLLHYMAKGNKLRIAIVLICITINTIAVVAGSMYLQTLIDKYIAPLIGNADASYTALVKPIITMIGIYVVRNSNNIY